MKYYNGNIFCHTPTVAPEKYYECRHMISIEQLPENCPTEKMFQAIRIGTEEWNNCVRTLKMQTDMIDGILMFERSSTLKQEVIDWLNENIADSTDKRRKDMPQGWMIYNPLSVHQTTSVSVFFLRRVDAMAFKLRWS